VDGDSVQRVREERGNRRCQVNQGGKREGAGRKPRQDGNGRSVPKSIKVSQGVADYLSEVGTGVIEDSLRKTKAFKQWAKLRKHNEA